MSVSWGEGALVDKTALAGGRCCTPRSSQRKKGIGQHWSEVLVPAPLKTSLGGFGDLQELRTGDTECFREDPASPLPPGERGSC